MKFSVSGLESVRVPVHDDLRRLQAGGGRPEQQAAAAELRMRVLASVSLGLIEGVIAEMILDGEQDDRVIAHALRSAVPGIPTVRARIRLAARCILE